MYILHFTFYEFPVLSCFGYSPFVGLWLRLVLDYCVSVQLLLQKEIRPLLWYPTVYLLVCIFPLINRWVPCSHPDYHKLFAWLICLPPHRIVYTFTKTPYLPLYILHVLSSPLPGETPSSLAHPVLTLLTSMTVSMASVERVLVCSDQPITRMN